MSLKTPVDRMLDAQYTKRWSLVGTDTENTVATHSFNVAVIAMAIRRKMFNTLHISEADVCYFALLHDIKEVYTGDIPTPTKVKMRAAGFDPETFDPEVPDENQPPPEIKAIIKLADLIDNSIFIAEHGTGTRARVAAAEVSRRLADALDGAPTDLQVAARWVLKYIQERRSESPEERRRFAEDNERFRQVSQIAKQTRAVLDRESRDIPGSA